jgi:hypothetical protein
VHFRWLARVRKNGRVFCTECELLGKDHQLAFERYKLSSLELSLRGGFLTDDECYCEIMRVINETREECDTVMAAMLTHLRSHETASENVVVIPF